MRTALPATLITLVTLLSAQDPVQDAETRLQKHLSSQATSAARVRVLLSRARGIESPVTVAVERLLAREDVDLLLETARRGRSARHRSIAANALVHAGRIDEALAAVMADRSKNPVRDVMARLASRGNTAPVVDSLARYLRSPSPRTRIRTAEALGQLGDPSAVPVLTKALRTLPRRPRGGGGPRAHVAFLTQTAIVRDFSVENA